MKVLLAKNIRLLLFLLVSINGFSQTDEPISKHGVNIELAGKCFYTFGSISYEYHVSPKITLGGGTFFIPSIRNDFEDKLQVYGLMNIGKKRKWQFYLSAGTDSYVNFDFKNIKKSWGYLIPFIGCGWERSFKKSYIRLSPYLNYSTQGWSPIMIWGGFTYGRNFYKRQ